MQVSHKILGLGLGAVLSLFMGTSALAQSDSTVVAEVGGVKVTMGELEQEESNKLLSAHYTYYQAEAKALEELVDKRVLEQKAKSEGLTTEQLINRDIRSQVKDPTEDQMKVFYEGLDTEQPYEAVRGKILDKIRDVRLNRATAAYVRALRAETPVFIALAPPHVSVDTANAAATVGPKAPVVTLVEFADYECPYCQKVAADLKKLQADMGDKVALSYKDFPLPMHSRAEKAAEAGRCAAKQGKFWELHDEMFQTHSLEVVSIKDQAHKLGLDSALFDKCLDSGEEAAAVEQDRKEGVKLGITGTPSFFINGHFLSGALDYASLKKVVDQQLAEAQGQSPVVASASK
ncbi:MAG TPA: thioredoxin domain-containing protein [Candidatus Sulfotelmatobacter sp.]